MADSISKSHLAVLRFWAQRPLPFAVKTLSELPPWEPAKSMIALLEAFGESRMAHYRELIEQSNELLNPLCDPLNCELDLHDWLRPEREESYTMWLQWSLRQLGDWESIGLALALKDGAHGRAGPISIGREAGVSYRDGVGRGQLDILIKEGASTVCIIEVKTKSFTDDDLSKQKSYLESPDVTPGTEGIFIAPERGVWNLRGFRFLSWAEICIGLRRLTPGIAKKKNLSTAALLLAFVGAVELNLLGFTSGKDLSSLPSTVEHLERFVNSVR